MDIDFQRIYQYNHFQAASLSLNDEEFNGDYLEKKTIARHDDY